MVIHDEILECQHDPIETEQGVACRHCGLVLDKIYEQTTSYRQAEGISHKKQQSGEYIHQSEVVYLPLELGCRTDFDSYKAKNQSLFQRLRRQNRMSARKCSQSYIYRHYLPRIKKITMKYGFSPIIQDEVTKHLLKLQSLGYFKGRRAEVIMYVLFHIFCRMHYTSHFLSDENAEIYEKSKGSPFFSLRSIAEIEKVSLKLLNTTFYRVVSALKINFTILPNEARTEGDTKIEQIAKAKTIQLRRAINDIIQYLVEKEGVDTSIREKIIPYIELMREIYQAHEFWKMKEPKWVVGGFIYLFQDKLTDKKLSQDIVCRAVNKSAVTLRNYIKQVRVILQKLGKKVK